MKQIYFICSGNTCRSPMAEGLFTKQLEMMHLAGIADVKSAGLSAFCGDAPSDYAVQAAKELGADIAAHRSLALTPYAFTEDAYFICMTQAHANALAPYVDADHILVLDVQDPFMGDIDVYRACAQELLRKMPLVFQFIFHCDGVFQMTAADVEGIARIEEQCFAHPWTKQGIEEELENNSARFFVCKCQNQIVGYIGANSVAGEVYMANLAVLPEARQKGYAKLLLYALDECVKGEGASFLSLEVRPSNRAALSLYQKFGFQEVGVRKDFYRDPQEDACILTKYYQEAE